MRRALALTLASLAAAAAAPAAPAADRALPFISVSYTNGETSKEASLGAPSGCFTMPGKVTAMACIDQKAANAVDEAKSKSAPALVLGVHGRETRTQILTYQSPPSVRPSVRRTTRIHTVTAPYAQVSGIFTNAGKSSSCSFWVEGTSTAYDALAKFPPTNVMVLPPATGTLTPNERVGFSFVLPVMENAGVAAMSGSSGRTTACSLVTKEQGTAAAAGLTIPAPTTKTTPAAAAQGTTTTSTTTTTTTPVAAASAAADKAAPAGEGEAAPLPAPVAGDAPEVKDSGVTSPAGRTAATWTFGLGAIVAAAAAGRALL